MLLALVCSLLAPRAAVAQTNAEVARMELERDAEGLFLNATLRFELPPIVLDALDKGIPMFFVVQARVMRDRWYWTDAQVASSTRYLRLAFLPLTRRWRLNTSSEPIGNAGLGVNLTQHYELLEEAVAAIERIRRWKIASPNEIESDRRYWVDFDFRLDLSQLPRPFQIGAVGQGEWDLSASRSQRLPPDAAK